MSLFQNIDITGFSRFRRWYLSFTPHKAIILAKFRQYRYFREQFRSFLSTSPLLLLPLRTCFRRLISWYASHTHRKSSRFLWCTVTSHTSLFMPLIAFYEITHITAPKSPRHWDCQLFLNASDTYRNGRFYLLSFLEPIIYQLRAYSRFDRKDIDCFISPLQAFTVSRLLCYVFDMRWIWYWYAIADIDLTLLMIIFAVRLLFEMKWCCVAR